MKVIIGQKQLREFGFILGFSFPILFGWFFPLMSGHQFRLWTLWIGGASLVLGIHKPYLLYYPYKGWIKLGNALGWINSRIILGLIFFMVLLPIALIMKFFNYDPLKKKKNQKKSYREKIETKVINLNRIF